MKKHIEATGELLKGLLLMVGLALVISIGIKWILAIALIPLLLLLSLLGIHINVDSETLSTRVSILAFLLALVYLLLGEKFLQKKRVTDDRR